MQETLAGWDNAHLEQDILSILERVRDALENHELKDEMHSISNKRHLIKLARAKQKAHPDAWTLEVRNLFALILKDLSVITRIVKSLSGKN